MKLPTNKLWEVDHFVPNEMMHEQFVEELDSMYGYDTNTRYDIITVHWKPITTKFLWMIREKTPQPTHYIFKRSRSPDEEEGWSKYESSSDYVELRKQIETHLESRYA